MARASRGFEVEEQGDWKQTAEYAQANAAYRRQLSRYQRDLGISDQHMYLLMRRQELRYLPQDQKNRANRPGQAVLVVYALLFMGSLNAGILGEAGLTLFALAVFVVLVALYVTGLLSPYRRALHKVARRLRGQPKVPSFEEWSARGEKG